MNGLNKNKAGLFLMEMIVVILFFSIMAVMSVRIFVHAKIMSQKSYALTNGISNLQTAAQLLKSDGGKIEPLQDYYGISGSEIYFNVENQVCIKQEADFVMEIQQKKQDDMIVNEMTFGKIDGENAICSMTTKVYVRGE